MTSLGAVLILSCGGDTGPRPVPTQALVQTPAASAAAASALVPKPSEAPALQPTALPSNTIPLAPTARPPAPAATLPPTPVSLEPVTVTVAARNLAFSPTVLTVPAHVVVTLVMRNEDSGVLHDVGVNVVGGGRTETCPGPCTSSFVFAAHEPGSYHFFCSLHPEMVGELKVTP